MEMRVIGADDAAAVQEVIESDPGYAERVTGHPPGPTDAVSLLMMRPEGLAEDAKVVLGGWTDDGLVAVVDLLRGYPDQATVFIGLLMVDGRQQGRGLGSAAYKGAEDYVRRWPEITKLRLAVVETNEQVTGFWTAMGFTPTGEVKPYTYDKLESTVRLYEKALVPSRRLGRGSPRGGTSPNSPRAGRQQG